MPEEVRGKSDTSVYLILYFCVGLFSSYEVDFTDVSVLTNLLFYSWKILFLDEMLSFRALSLSIYVSGKPD